MNQLSHPSRLWYYLVDQQRSRGKRPEALSTSSTSTPIPISVIFILSIISSTLPPLPALHELSEEFWWWRMWWREGVHNKCGSSSPQLERYLRIATLYHVWMLMVQSKECWFICDWATPFLAIHSITWSTSLSWYKRFRHLLIHQSSHVTCC